MKVTLRTASEEDLQIIHNIELEVYPSPWTLNFFRIMFHMNIDLFIVAIRNSQIIGYIVGEINTNNKVRLRNVGHILNVVVRREFQGKGVGTMLLNELEGRFFNRGADIAYLEVRETNKRAQQIYMKRGYRHIMTSKNYYGDEDGFIMTKKLQAKAI